jgi:dTDP-4-dehydrorhamnose reductase
MTKTISGTGTMKKILITGSNGLLGQKLIALLKGKKDIALVATAKGPSRLPDPQGYDYEEMDINDSGRMEEVFSKYEPDTVIHAAAITQVDLCETDKHLCWRTNVKSTGEIVRLSKKYRAHLIYLSTDPILFLTEKRDLTKKPTRRIP